MSQDFMGDLIYNTFQAKAVEIAEKMIAEGRTLDEIQKEIDSLDVTRATIAVVTAASDDSVNNFKEQMYERVFEHHANEAMFIAHNDLIWGKAFAASEAMYLMTLDAAESYRKIFDELDGSKKEPLQYRFRVLLELHARACQQFLEIICLMKSGFADGAYARWRSLYELSVIAQFIRQNEENVAQEFHKSWYSDESDYDWARAAPCFKTAKYKKRKYLSFNAIQKQCDFSQGPWKGQYDLANKTVHASSQGTFGRLGACGKQTVIAVGHSDYGLALPGINSANILAIISAIFFNFIVSGDGCWYSYTISKWAKLVREYYENAEKTHFDMDTTSPDVNLPRNTTTQV